MTADTSNGGNTFAYEVTDFYGNVVKKNDKKYCKEGKFNLSLSGLDVGYYEITAYNNAEKGKKQLAKTTFSILERHEFKPASESYFGVNMHMYRSYQSNGWGFNLIKNAYNIGAVNLRDGREWEDVENPKGTYNFKYAQFMEMINERNMDLLMITGFKNKNYQDGLPPYTDEGRQAFANYSKAAFEQYKGFLKSQEMFNEWWKYEPDDDGVRDYEEIQGTYDEYFEIAKKTYTTIDKENYPNAFLLAEFRDEMDTWSKPLIEAGIIDYMDGAALHRYGMDYGKYNPIHLPEDDVVTSEVKQLRKLLDENGGADKPIWLTETGYTTTINKYGVTEEEQAKYLPRLLINFISEGVEKLYWYDLLDDGIVDYEDKGATHEYHFGLMRSKENSLGGFSPKPAYVSYGVLTRVLDGKKYQEKEIVEKGSFWNKYKICRYVFKDETTITTALCTSKSTTNVTLVTDEVLKVTDLMGRKSELVPENGEINLTLTDNMIYIDGEFTMK